MASRNADTSSVDARDRDLLQSPTGRVPPTDEGEPDARLEEIRAKSGGSRPVGDVTNVPLSGGGDAETPDGLDEAAEEVRHAAEDRPDEPSPYEAEPGESPDDDLILDELAESNLEEPLSDDEQDEEEPEAGALEDVPVFDRGSVTRRRG